ncbi:hypothetical protein EVAR_23996_1 [Eumeta japonica]|uniref:Uncharacterized protein n=1 Tax=Eumeta variegata TaxID=151549 RepID=A0A4C1W8N5_EUMVA|nr:hypothetical protein EVAR_23996_1 [Eumeta japonica]
MPRWMFYRDRKLRARRPRRRGRRDINTRIRHPRRVAALYLLFPFCKISPHNIMLMAAITSEIFTNIPTNGRPLTNRRYPRARLTVARKRAARRRLALRGVGWY